MAPFVYVSYNCFLFYFIRCTTLIKICINFVANVDENDKEIALHKCLTALCRPLRSVTWREYKAIKILHRHVSSLDLCLMLVGFVAQYTRDIQTCRLNSLKQEQDVFDRDVVNSRFLRYSQKMDGTKIHQYSLRYYTFVSANLTAYHGDFWIENHNLFMYCFCSINNCNKNTTYRK